MNRGLQLASGMLATLVVVGCGGGASSETAGAITKAEFISQADAICAETNQAMEDKVQATFGGGSQPGKAEQEAFVTETILPSIEGDLEKVRALPEPAGDEAAIDQFLSDAEKGVAEAKKDPEGFPKSAPSLQKSSGEAAAYGLKVCGQDG